MLPTKFESLISKPWPEEEEVSFYGGPYHLSKNKPAQPDKTAKDKDDDGLDDVAILGYN